MIFNGWVIYHTISMLFPIFLKFLSKLVELCHVSNADYLVQELLEKNTVRYAP